MTAAEQGAALYGTDADRLHEAAEQLRRALGPAHFERHRSRYYHLLFEASATGDLTPWIDCLLDAVAHQSRDGDSPSPSGDLLRE